LSAVPHQEQTDHNSDDQEREIHERPSDQC
jgi:hypothetical protein